MHGATIKIRVF